MMHLFTSLMQVGESLKRVAVPAAPTEAGAAALGTAAALISVSLGAKNVGFLIVTLMVMTLDLVTGIARPYLDPRRSTPSAVSGVGWWASCSASPWCCWLRC